MSRLHLPEGLPGQVQPLPSIEIIMHAACETCRVGQRDLASPCRHPKVVLARAIITRVARHLTLMSYPEIARAIGRPNHSTVITADQRLKQRLQHGVGHPARTILVDGLPLDAQDILTRVIDQSRRAPVKAVTSMGRTPL